MKNILLTFFVCVTMCNAQAQVDTTETVTFPPDYPAIDAFVMLDKEPTPLNLDSVKALIGYPGQAQENCIQGRVIVRMLVDKRGKVVEDKIVFIKSAHDILKNAVSDQIKHLRCSPGIQSSQPVAVWMTIPFDFVLSKCK